MKTTERTSKVVEGEMEALKGKIRDLEGKKLAHGKMIDKARATRKAGAFKAHADGDSKAAAALVKSRENEICAVMEMEDVESAISEGTARFERLEREWKAVLDAEAWAALMVAHGRRLETLKRQAYSLGFERVFATVGLRHADRVFAWRMIQEGFAAEFEKPSDQYRTATGYAGILAEQVAAAKATHDRAMKEHEADGQGGDGLNPEPMDAGAEAGATT